MDKKKKKMPRWRMLSFILISCITLASLPVTPLWAAEETESANMTVSEDMDGQTEENTDGTEAVSETTEETPAILEECADIIEDDQNKKAVLADEINEPDVKATDPPMSGICGKGGSDNVKWMLTSDGVLTISGNGEMEDFKYFNASSSPWCRNHNIKTIIIENGVKSIGNGAFWDVFNLTNITIASSVTRIGEYAFKSCYHIQNLVLPDGVTTIEHHAFWACSELKSITIPNSVNDIGELVFHDCIKLEEIYVEPQNTSYISKDGVLFNKQKTDLIKCPSEKEGQYRVPDTVNRIANCAFSHCWKLTNIVMADNVTDIGSDAFYSCGSLKRIKLSNQLKSICAGTFYNCRSLPSIIIPNGVTDIEAYAFRGCESLLNIRIPRSMISINEYAFYECYKLKYIFFCGDKNRWELIENVASNTIIKNAAVLYNSVDSDCKVYRDNGDEQFDCALEMCIRSVPSSYDYNPQLAHMLIAMCNSVFDGSNMYKTFDSFRFDIQNTDYNSITIEGDIVLGYGIAKKLIGDRTLVLLIGRGTDSLEEWFSNAHITVNDRKQHTGFADAANALYNELSESFLRDVDLTRTDFVITGFSRGAAVTNILAAKLIDEGISKENVFAYNFACPDTVQDNDGVTTRSEYSSIFNIADANDIVSWAPGSITFANWRATGRKYGNSYWYSDVWDDFEKLEMGMDAHNQALYLEALRRYDNLNFQLSEFKYRSATKKALDDAVDKRDEKFWNDVHNTALNILGCTSVYCPVNVEVYDSKSQLVGKVEYSLISDVNTDKIYISVTDDKKDIYMLDNDTYSFKLTATDEGSMDFTMKKILVSDRSILESKDFTSVTLTKGKIMTSKVSVWDDRNEDPSEGDKADIQDVRLIVLDDKGKPDKEVLPDGKGTEVDVDAPDISPSPSGKPRPSTTPGNGNRKPIVKVKNIKITGPSKKVAAGKKIALKASVSPSNTTNKAVVWKSSNNKYATVNSKGVVTIKKAAKGKTIIITATAKDGSKKKASYKIQCMKGIVKKVAISGKKTRSIKAGKTIKLRAIIKAAKGADKTLKWSSNNTKYATVDSKGKVTTKKAGKGKTVRITASATDGSGKKAVIKIKLK